MSRHIPRDDPSDICALCGDTMYCPESEDCSGALSTAEMAAHLRERDDLRDVLRLVRAAWWRTDQEIVPMGGHEGYACARIGPDHATSGHWWSRVWIEAWATTGQQVVNRHASEEEARAFVLATMQADGWVVLP